MTLIRCSHSLLQFLFIQGLEFMPETILQLVLHFQMKHISLQRKPWLTSSRSNKKGKTLVYLSNFHLQRKGSLPFSNKFLSASKRHISSLVFLCFFLVPNEKDQTPISIQLEIILPFSILLRSHICFLHSPASVYLFRVTKSCSLLVPLFCFKCTLGKVKSIRNTRNNTRECVHV